MDELDVRQNKNQTMKPWTFPESLRLEGKYVTLRPFSVTNDVDELFEISHGDPSKEAIWDYLYYGPFPDRKDMETWYKEELLVKQDIVPWVILGTETASIIGFVAFMSIVPAHGRAEIGHVWLTPSAHKSKANTEAQFLLLSHIFDTHRYRRVEWRCNSLNHASRTAATRLGFTFEGRFRKHMFLKGENRDTDWFAMTDFDWPRVKANFLTYLRSDTKVSLMKLNTE